MHEYSVVQALLNQCEEVAEQNNAKTVTKVITKIGVMSGIETHLLQTAFDTFKEGTIPNTIQDKHMIIFHKDIQQMYTSYTTINDLYLL